MKLVGLFSWNACVSVQGKKREGVVRQRYTARSNAA